MMQTLGTEGGKAAESSPEFPDTKKREMPNSEKQKKKILSVEHQLLQGQIPAVIPAQGMSGSPGCKALNAQ